MRTGVTSQHMHTVVNLQSKGSAPVMKRLRTSCQRFSLPTSLPPRAVCSTCRARRGCCRASCFQFRRSSIPQCQDGAGLRQVQQAWTGSPSDCQVSASQPPWPAPAACCWSRQPAQAMPVRVAAEHLALDVVIGLFCFVLTVRQAHSMTRNEVTSGSWLWSSLARASWLAYLLDEPILRGGNLQLCTLDDQSRDVLL